MDIEYTTKAEGVIIRFYTFYVYNYYWSSYLINTEGYELLPPPEILLPEGEIHNINLLYQFARLLNNGLPTVITFNFELNQNDINYIVAETGFNFIDAGLVTPTVPSAYMANYFAG